MGSQKCSSHPHWTYQQGMDVQNSEEPQAIQRQATKTPAASDWQVG